MSQEVKVYYAIYNGMAQNPTEELLTFVEKKRLKQPLYSGGGNNGFVRLVNKSEFDRVSKEFEDFKKGQAHFDNQYYKQRDQIKLMEAEIEKLKESKKFTSEFYAVRFQRLRDLLKETPYFEKFCRISANGTADPFENPTYAQQLNIKQWEIKSLKEKMNLAVGALEKAKDSFNYFGAFINKLIQPEVSESVDDITQTLKKLQEP